MYAVSKRRQSGVTMLMALVVLVLLAMFAAWSFKISTGNLKIVGNAQARQEGLAAANAAIEATISSPLFTTEPALVAARPITVDLDGDGMSDASGQLSPPPACYRVKAISQLALDENVEADRNCMKGGSGNAGLDSGAPTSGESLCSNSEWALRAVVTDNRTRRWRSRYQVCRRAMRVVQLGGCVAGVQLRRCGQ